MKSRYIILLSFLSIIICSFFIYEDPIKGQVLDEEGKPIIGASVWIEGTEMGTITDLLGRFTLDCPSDSCALMISYVGYEDSKVTAKSNADITIEIKEGGVICDEIVVTGMSISKVEKNSFTIGSAAKTTNSRIKGYESMVFEDAMLDQVSHHDLKISAGQITAGEWNDLTNWEDWKTLLANSDYQQMQSYWNMFPKKRYILVVTNQYDFPLPECKVLLLDKMDHVIWEARTDHSGKAELWSGVSGEDEKAQSIEVKTSSGEYSISSVKDVDQGSNYLKVQDECPKLTQMDIAFVVDATGSMGDEIAYLQSELVDVIDRAKKLRPSLAINFGSVFYRDKEDEYLTRNFPFNKKKNKLIQFVNQQEAMGGGDYPEAVHTAIEEALDMDWSDKAIARLMFLLLDAPPHHEEEVLHDLQAQIREAAARGIKIIPITASGINRQTEFLMKFMAMATNGTYVFITDDSGIGNPHLDPVVEDYEIEYLNDLVLRLIENYSQTSRCMTDQRISEYAIKLFPNPTSNFINVELEEDATYVRLLTSSGKLIRKQGPIKSGQSKLNLEKLISGVYTLQFVFGEQQESRQVILLD